MVPGLSIEYKIWVVWKRIGSGSYYNPLTWNRRSLIYSLRSIS
jgi:hypothetical protein